MSDSKGGRPRTGTVITLPDGRRQGIVSLPNGRRHRLPPFPEKWSDAKCTETVAHYSENPKPEWLVAPPLRKRAPKLSAKIAGGADWWKAYFEHREAKGLTTVAGMYKAHLLPVLGDKHPKAWTPADCEAVRDALDAKIQAGFWESAAGDGKPRRYPFGWKRAWNVWALFTSACKAASRSKNKALRVRADNPCSGIEPPDRGVRRKTQWLRPAEFLALIGCREIPDRWAELYTLLAYTYLRPNELAALLWQDVDLKAGMIRVTKAWDFDAGEPKDHPKTAAGVRWVPIEPALLPVLEVLGHGEAPGARVVAAMPPAEDWAATMRTHLRRAGVSRPELFERSATVRPVTLYSLRHTGITWRTIRGDDVRAIQRHAGHEKYATTEGYVHEAEDFRGKVGAVFPLVIDVLTNRADPELRSGFDQGEKSGQKRRRNGVPKGIRSWSDPDFARGFRSESKRSEAPILGDTEANSANLPARSVGRSEPDALEVALADALGKAVAAGQWAAVEVIAAELRARRGG